MTKTNWIAIVGLVLALLSAGAGVAYRLFFDRTEGEVLKAEFKSHTSSQVKREKDQDEDWREMRAQQRAISDNVIRIGERLRVKELKTAEDYE